MSSIVLVFVNVILFLCLILSLTPYGKIRLGGKNATPRYGIISWLSMLFAAGMGSGLMFWAVAEPVMHLNHSPQMIEDNEVNALSWTFLHWGFHAWAIYTLCAITLGFFAYNKQQPMLASGPIMAGLPVKWQHESLKKLTDWLSIAAIFFGIIGSLGMASTQLSEGASHLFYLSEQQAGTQHATLILLPLAFVALLSACLPIKKGIRWLSNLNIFLMLLFTGMVMVYASNALTVGLFVDSFTHYLSSLLERTLGILSKSDHHEWLESWTVTYFLWWMAWAPFVGMFIARISYGRSLRQSIWCVILIPSSFSFLWFTLFGQAGFSLDGLERIVASPQNATYMLSEFIEYKALFSWLCFILMAIFLVTSVDSGTYVLAMFSSDGNLQPSVKTRLLWGLGLALSALFALQFDDVVNTMRQIGYVGGLFFIWVLMAYMVSLVIGVMKLAKEEKDSL